MLSVKDFKKLTLHDKDIFDKHYEKYPPVHSDDVFTTMLSWMKYSKYSYAKVDDNIIIKNEIDKNISFRSPIGDRNVELLKEVFSLAVEYGSDKPFVVVDVFHGKITYNDPSFKDWVSISLLSIFKITETVFSCVFAKTTISTLLFIVEPLIGL